MCKGGKDIYPIKNYWKASEYTDQFYECPVANVCLGGVDKNLTTGECETGYNGRMCTVCDENWSKMTTWECGK